MDIQKKVRIRKNKLKFLLHPPTKKLITIKAVITSHTEVMLYDARSTVIISTCFCDFWIVAKSTITLATK
jgi:hypothetical protein